MNGVSELFDSFGQELTIFEHMQTFTCVWLHSL